MPKAFHRYAVLHKKGLVTGVAPLPIILCSYGASLFPIIAHRHGKQHTSFFPYETLLFTIITHRRCFQIVASSGGKAETTG